jgi:hypothetical protein
LEREHAKEREEHEENRARRHPSRSSWVFVPSRSKHPRGQPSGPPGDECHGSRQSRLFVSANPFNPLRKSVDSGFHTKEEPMGDFFRVVTSFIYAAALIGCLWWANLALRQLDIPRRFNLPPGVRLLVVLAVGALVYSPVSQVLNGLFAIFVDYYTGWVKVAEVVAALAILGFIGWLYTRGVQEA